MIYFRTEKTWGIRACCTIGTNYRPTLISRPTKFYPHVFARTVALHRKTPVIGCKQLDGAKVGGATGQGWRMAPQLAVMGALERFHDFVHSEPYFELFSTNFQGRLKGLSVIRPIINHSFQASRPTKVVKNTLPKLLCQNYFEKYFGKYFENTFKKWLGGWVSTIHLISCLLNSSKLHNIQGWTYKMFF